MSNAPSSGSHSNELQFDRAEYAGPTPVAACRACGQSIADVYYDVNGQPFCQTCRGHLQTALEGGSKTGRFVRATLFGFLAGLVGAAIYYGVTVATNFNFGLISVLVGFMVGKAVKMGSNGRGGWFYQGLAMLLTYTAIVLTYFLPVVVEALAGREGRAPAPQAARAGQPNPADAQVDAQVEADAKAIAKAGEPGACGARRRPSLGLALLGLAYLLALAFALPISGNLDSPIGLIIVAIGLYEAWVINKRVPISIQGPYRIGPPRPGSAVDVQSTG